MGIYRNKKGKEFNLTIDSRFNVIRVHKGIAQYPDELAKRYPSIFELVEEEKEIIIMKQEEENKTPSEEDSEQTLINILIGKGK